MQALYSTALLRLLAYGDQDWDPYKRSSARNWENTEVRQHT